MPLYSFKCINSKCENEVFDVFLGINEKHEAHCPECRIKARRVWDSFGFAFDFKSGYDAGLGEYVDSKKQREEIMRRKGLRRIRD